MAIELTATDQKELLIDALIGTKGPGSYKAVDDYMAKGLGTQSFSQHKWKWNKDKLKTLDSEALLSLWKEIKS